MGFVSETAALRQLLCSLAGSSHSSSADFSWGLRGSLALFGFSLRKPKKRGKKYPPRRAAHQQSGISPLHTPLLSQLPLPPSTRSNSRPAGWAELSHSVLTSCTNTSHCSASSCLKKNPSWILRSCCLRAGTGGCQCHLHPKCGSLSLILHFQLSIPNSPS